VSTSHAMRFLFPTRTLRHESLMPDGASMSIGVQNLIPQ
jgi:hypothetical protein